MTNPQKIVSDLLEGDFDSEEVEALASVEHNPASLGWDLQTAHGDRFWVKHIYGDVVIKFLYFETWGVLSSAVQVFRRVHTGGWEIVDCVKKKHDETLIDLLRRAERQVRRNFRFESLDPDEVEAIAATPSPPKFISRNGTPIETGDIVMVYPDWQEYEDEIAFVGRVVSTNRGLLQVWDAAGEAEWDVRPDSADIAPPSVRWMAESKDFKKWIGVDLDGTLAKGTKDFDPDKVGEPVEAMVDRVKKWLDQGKTVKIFTARAGAEDFDPAPVKEWCKKHLGQELEITNEKDPGMEELWDDRVVQVVKNTGEVVEAFDPEEVEAIAATPGNLWHMGFKPAKYTGDQGHWQKSLGKKGEGLSRKYYTADVFMPNERHRDYRLHIISWEGVGATNLLKHVDVSTLAEVAGAIDEFIRRVGIGESIDPDEVELIAYQALDKPWTRWFKDNKFNYSPGEGMFYRKWHDPNYPTWTYMFAVVPTGADGKDKFDVYWNYIDERSMDTYASYTVIRDASEYEVQKSFAWGERMIASGQMAYEMARI